MAASTGLDLDPSITAAMRDLGALASFLDATYQYYYVNSHSLPKKLQYCAKALHLQLAIYRCNGADFLPTRTYRDNAQVAFISSLADAFAHPQSGI